ncbi:hypothetical protein [Aggregatilinea lenta]|uniref:hypothetical protein n=1 Tax=Aggregatilinea lenta TaxID=913108 RepID=UPI000E5C42E6|nr:hypothetical protein [Aggregatilinea lenta]
MYSKVVDRRNRKVMTRFLRNHFRYSTMNSWNLATSYAHCVKITRMSIPHNLLGRAFDMLESEEVQDALSLCIDAWERKYNYAWQVKFNGRSNGYLVLCRGGRSPEGRVYAQPGLAVDDDADYEEWPIEELRERVAVVQSFDALCDELAALFLSYVRHYKFVEEIVMVPQTVRRLREVA